MVKIKGYFVCIESTYFGGSNPSFPTKENQKWGIWQIGKAALDIILTLDVPLKLNRPEVLLVTYVTVTHEIAGSTPVWPAKCGVY